MEGRRTGREEVRKGVGDEEGLRVYGTKTLKTLCLK